MDLTDNMMLRSFRNGRSPFTDRKPSKKLAEDVVENLDVVTPGITTPVRRLSGGNVQKVLVGREIASRTHSAFDGLCGARTWTSTLPILFMIC